MGKGNKSGCDRHPPGRATGSLPCPSPGQHLPLSKGWKSFYCPTPKSSCMAFEEPLGRDEAPVRPSATLAAVAGGWRRSQRWRGSTGKRRELGWCDSLTGPPEKYNPGELELNPSAAGEIKSGLCPGPAWGQELCPQPEQQLAVPNAQEDDTSRWER